ncbi:MAG: hypothetical protein KF715_15020 [Candidatus Didemnitutus sp.]|nr:hypothetical protein [Candidatus Didemnitutus sp.]
MRKSFQRPLLIVATLGVVGLLGLAIRARQAMPAMTSVPRAAGAPASGLAADKIVVFETPAAVADTDGASGLSAARVVEQLPASESAQFATLIELQLAATDMNLDLDLTTKQWQAFAAAVVQAQAVRHNFEATIATATEIAPGRYRIDIPAYAAAGDELRRQFMADLERGLGRDAATEVTQAFAHRFEGSFAGFGVSAQTLEVTGDPARGSANVEVSRTVRYWDSADGRERMTTRREVHFPSDEDPSGERWNALLALVPVAS